MAREDIHRLIDERIDDHVDKIRQYVRQPSVSQTGEGIREGAELLASYYRELGCAEVDIVETDGLPGVFAFYDAGAPRTIVTYAMYDVQPADPAEWTHPPFEGTLAPHDGHPKVLFGRGAYFAKGPHRAFLNALESIIAVEGTLPVNIYFLAEGEEEIGSPHYDQVAKPYADRLSRADASLTLGVAQDASGRVPVFLGNKGFVYFELISRADQNGHGVATHAVHDSLQGVVGTPAWRLAAALDCLVDSTTGRVRIPGFYDDVRAVSDTDLSLTADLHRQLSGPAFINALPNFGEGSLDAYANGMDEKAALTEYVFSPTFNLNGIYGGYTGPGTVNFTVPRQLVATLDCRLVPDMEPDVMLRALRAHLDDQGFADIELEVRSQYTWAKTDFDDDVVQAAMRVYNDLGLETFVWPSRGTSGAWWVLNRYLGLPTLLEAGVGSGSGFHAPDEYLVIESDGTVGGLADCEKSHVDLLCSYARYPNAY